MQKDRSSYPATQTVGSPSEDQDQDGKGGDQSIGKAGQSNAFFTQGSNDAEIVVAKGVPKIEDLNANQFQPGTKVVRDIVLRLG